MHLKYFKKLPVLYEFELSEQNGKAEVETVAWGEQMHESKSGRSDGGRNVIQVKVLETMGSPAKSYHLGISSAKEKYYKTRKV